MAKNSCCPKAVESNTIPFQASGSNAPIETRSNDSDLVCAKDRTEALRISRRAIGYNPPRKRATDLLLAVVSFHLGVIRPVLLFEISLTAAQTKIGQR